MKSSSSPAETAVAHTTVTPLLKMLNSGEEKSTPNGNRCDDEAAAAVAAAASCSDSPHDDECTSQSDGLVLSGERQQNGQCSSEEPAVGDDGASEQRRCACEPADLFAWIRTFVNDDTRVR